MTGWDIVSLIVLVAIAGFFARVQLAERFESLRGRRQSPTPRSLQESGGYLTQRPSRSRMERNAPPDTHDLEDRPGDRRQSPRPAATRRQRSGIGAEVRRQLRAPGSAKVAFAMREVIDTPVGMRDEEWP